MYVCMRWLEHSFDWDSLNTVVVSMVEFVKLLMWRAPAFETNAIASTMFSRFSAIILRLFCTIIIAMAPRQRAALKGNAVIN